MTYSTNTPANLTKATLSPIRIISKRLFRNPVAVSALILLIFLHLTALFAPFLSPYSPVTQRLADYYHPPTKLFWSAPGESFSIRPYIAPDIPTPSHHFILSPQKRAPIIFLAHGFSYKLFGIIPCSIHLFESKYPINLLGTDDLGRDIFSRLLYGAQISLSVGLIAIAISYTLGLLVGGIAGYYGGTIDSVLMRFCDVLMAVPGFYLLLALTAILPTSLSSAERYTLIIVILSFVGWAALARVIRGIALSTRERSYVEAARALGVSNMRIILRHILPETSTFAIVSATLAVPGYILAEAALSFLGLGIREPTASWGNMLASAENLEALTQYPWILVPGIAIFITVIGWNVLGDGLRDALDPKGLR